MNDIDANFTVVVICDAVKEGTQIKDRFPNALVVSDSKNIMKNNFNYEDIEQTNLYVINDSNRMVYEGVDVRENENKIKNYIHSIFLPIKHIKSLSISDKIKLKESGDFAIVDAVSPYVDEKQNKILFISSSTNTILSFNLKSGELVDKITVPDSLTLIYKRDIDSAYYWERMLHHHPQVYLMQILNENRDSIVARVQMFSLDNPINANKKYPYHKPVTNEETALLTIKPDHQYSVYPINYGSYNWWKYRFKYSPILSIGNNSFLSRYYLLPFDNDSFFVAHYLSPIDTMRYSHDSLTLFGLISQHYDVENVYSIKDIENMYNIKYTINENYVLYSAPNGVIVYLDNDNKIFMKLNYFNDKLHTEKIQQCGLLMPGKIYLNEDSLSVLDIIVDDSNIFVMLQNTQNTEQKKKQIIIQSYRMNGEYNSEKVLDMNDEDEILSAQFAGIEKNKFDLLIKWKNKRWWFIKSSIKQFE